MNLLSELELNRRREEEGLDPINIAWPWGAGRRQPVPNLLLRRGEQAVVESSSMRLQGLARLAAYTHADRVAVGAGVRTRFAPLARQALSRNLSLIVLDGAAELRREDRLEELEWFAKEMDRELLTPLVEEAGRNQSRLVVLAPSELGDGLGVSTESNAAGSLPFDLRTTDELRLRKTDLWTEIEQGLLMPESP